MRSPRFFAPLSLIATSCIIPDTDIQVYSTQGCGDQYSASTAQAVGYNGIGEDKPIKTPEGEWIIHYWCLSPDQSYFMQYENSILHQNILQEVRVACQSRALELELGQDSCADVAAVAYSGECPGESEWCEVAESDDEVGVALDMMR